MSQHHPREMLDQVSEFSRQRHRIRPNNGLAAALTARPFSHSPSLPTTSRYCPPPGVHAPHAVPGTSSSSGYPSLANRQTNRNQVEICDHRQVCGNSAVKQERIDDGEYVENEALLDDDGEEDDDFDDELVEVAENIGSLKRKLLKVEKQRKSMTREHQVAMDDLIEKHKQNLIERRRKHAQEISLLEDHQSRERVELMKKNQIDGNLKTVNINEVKMTLSNLRKKLKRKFRGDNEEVDIPECPVCMVEMTAPRQIYQCQEGHLICSDCKPKWRSGCATCRSSSGYVGRCRFLEDMIQKKVKTE